MPDSPYEQLTLNPYAAPTALPPSEAAGIGIPPSGEPGDLRIASILRSSWDIFKLHWGHAIVALFVIFAIDAWVGLAFNVLEKFLLKGIGDPVFVLPFVILYMFLRFVLHLWLCTGWIIFIVRCIQGHAPDITYMFRSRLYFSRVLGAVLLRTLMIGLIFGIIELMIGIQHYTVRPFSIDGETAGVLGLFISAIVAFPIYVRYSQVTYLILDRNVGVRESLQLSRQMVKGQMKQIIFVQAAIWGIGISGFFFCFFPVFGTLAFSEIALIVLYQRMLRTVAVV